MKFTLDVRIFLGSHWLAARVLFSYIGAPLLSGQGCFSPQCCDMGTDSSGFHIPQGCHKDQGCCSQAKLSYVTQAQKKTFAKALNKACHIPFSQLFRLMKMCISHILKIVKITFMEEQYYPKVTNLLIIWMCARSWILPEIYRILGSYFFGKRVL